MKIPSFPKFISLSLGLKDEIHPRLSSAPDGVSEFTFAGLYLFRSRYNYHVSELKDRTLIISGVQPPKDGEGEKKFFMTPCASVERSILQTLFQTHDYWKNISDSVLISHRSRLEQWGIQFDEDRDNFDYLYLRQELAELKGKKYHKKRNLLAQFHKLYRYEKKLITAGLISDAMAVLEKWREDDREKGGLGEDDYAECKDALLSFGELNMQGLLVYIDGEPAAWCLGEPVANGRIFAVHFEKGLEKFKGIYQFLNQAFAAELPEHFTHINREQDLGNGGLRQAKMSYRPTGFVRKYRGLLIGELS